MWIRGVWHDYCKLGGTKSETYENNNYSERAHDLVVLFPVAVGATVLTDAGTESRQLHYLFAKQIRPSFFCTQHRLLMPPFFDLSVIAAHKNVGHFPATEINGACIHRRSKQVILE